VTDKHGAPGGGITPCAVASLEALEEVELVRDRCASCSMSLGLDRNAVSAGAGVVA
jgi:hypothetical protein